MDHGTDGVLVDDLGELVDAMRMLMAQPEQAAIMGSAGKKKAMTQYTWSAVAQRLHQIVTETCDSARNRIQDSDRSRLPAASGEVDGPSRTLSDPEQGRRGSDVSASSSAAPLVPIPKSLRRRLDLAR